MGGGVLADLGRRDGAGDGALENGFVDVVAAALAGLAIDVVAAGGPAPEYLRSRASGRATEAGAGGQVALVHGAHFREMRAQGHVEPRRQHGHPVPAALAIANRQLVPWGIAGDAQSHFDPLWEQVDPEAGKWFPAQGLQLARNANPSLL